MYLENAPFFVSSLSYRLIIDLLRLIAPYLAYLTRGSLVLFHTVAFLSSLQWVKLPRQLGLAESPSQKIKSGNGVPVRNAVMAGKRLLLALIGAIIRQL